MAHRELPGTIKDVTGSFIPWAYLACDGSVYAQSAYPALFAQIGTTWNTGGEGAGNFRIPDSRGSTPIGAGQGTYGGASARTLGQFVGEEAHLLTDSESGVAAHSHTVNDPQHHHNINNLGVTASAGGDVTAFYGGVSNGTDSQPTGITLDPAAPVTAVSAHNTMQPSIVVTRMIKW